VNSQEILIAWLRCFDDGENDQRMASRCADALEQANERIDVGLRGERSLNERIEKLEEIVEAARKVVKYRDDGTEKDLQMLEQKIEALGSAGDSGS